MKLFLRLSLACSSLRASIVLAASASINGAGIAVLTQLLLESDKLGQPVAISGPSENFTKVFEIVGITTFVDIFETEEAAGAMLQGKGAGQ